MSAAADEFKKRLAYQWELKDHHIEKVWLPTIVPPSSLRAVADRVAAQKKALRDARKKR